MQTYGTRRQVWNKTAIKTRGGLVRSDLFKKKGRIKSKKASKKAKAVTKRKATTKRKTTKRSTVAKTVAKRKTTTKVAAKQVGAMLSSTKVKEESKGLGIYTYDTPISVIEKKYDFKASMPSDTKLGDYFKMKGSHAMARLLGGE